MHSKPTANAGVMSQNGVMVTQNMQEAFGIEKESLIAAISEWELSEADKGQIYTRSEVVELMLTVIGLNTCNDFKNVRILEPSCGEGEFVIAIVSRLINLPKKRPTVKQLADKLLAVDLVANSLEITKRKVASLLETRGYSKAEVTSLLNKWFLSTDFLLEDITPEEKGDASILERRNDEK